MKKTSYNIIERFTNDVEFRFTPNLVFFNYYKSQDQIKYRCYHANITENLSSSIGKWLKQNIQDLKIRLDQSTPDELQIYERDLTEITHWEEFWGNIKNITYFDKNELYKSLKKNMKGICVYDVIDDYQIGYIRHLTPSNLFVRTGLFKLEFNNGSFNSIKEDKDPHIDKFYDFIFVLNKKNKFCYIKPDTSLRFFETLFALYEIETRQIKDIFQQTPVWNSSECTDLSLFQEIILKNGNFRRTALSVGAQTGWEDADYNLFKLCRDIIGNGLEIELDEKNHKIILHDTKSSVKSFLRVIAYQDRKTLDDKHIFKGSANERIT